MDGPGAALLSEASQTKAGDVWIIYTWNLKTLNSWKQNRNMTTKDGGWENRTDIV